MTQKTHKHIITLNVHPIHFHIGMYVALAALAITAMKASEGVISSMYHGNSSAAAHTVSQTHMAETHVGHAQLRLNRAPDISGA